MFADEHYKREIPMPECLATFDMSVQFHGWTLDLS